MKAKGMDALAYDLKNICDHNRDGSHATRSNRHRMLQAASRQLRVGGYTLTGAHSLKPKHIEFLVQNWQDEGLTSGTKKNRMGALRWWAQKVNKASVIPRDNNQLGIEERTHDNGNKAQKLDLDKLEKIESPQMRMSARLMAAFGLRMEEALKFQPELADNGDTIGLKASWTKGGRYREIPISSGRQRALLGEAKELAGEGSLIPNDKSYIQHRKAFEYQTLKAGFSNLHGLRHNYAQARYKAMTGWKCPKAGGLEKHEMTPKQRVLDREARQTISTELGHNRIEISKNYLG